MSGRKLTGAQRTKAARARKAGLDLDDLEAAAAREKKYRVLLRRAVHHKTGPGDIAMPTASKGRVPQQAEAESIAIEAMEQALPRLATWQKETQATLASWEWTMCCYLSCLLVLSGGAIGLGTKLASINIALAAVTPVALILLGVGLGMWGSGKRSRAKAAADDAAKDVKQVFQPFNERLLREMPSMKLRARCEVQEQHERVYDVIIKDWVVVMELLTSSDATAVVAVPQINGAVREESDVEALPLAVIVNDREL